MVEWDKDCTGCGYCCQQTPCIYAWIMNGPEAPCSYLVHKGGRYWCGMILAVDGELRDKLSKGLRIGQGCIGPWVKEELERLNGGEV